MKSLTMAATTQNSLPQNLELKKDENKINISIAQISSQQNCNIYIYIFKKKKNSKFIISNNKEVYLSIRYEYIELLCTNNSAIRTIKC